jgi:CRP-like cAMP-binding protein
MSDHDPILLRRLLELRRFPLFASAELGELAMLAENVVEAWHDDGAMIARPSTLDAIHLILSGRIDVGATTYGAHQAFGVLEVLARRPLAMPAIAVGETRTLRLTAPDLREVLEDNFGLLLIVVRELAVRTLAVREAGPLGRPLGRPLAVAAPMATSLGLVERMIVLRRQIPFVPIPSCGPPSESHGRSAPLEAIAALAAATKETTWPAGAVMARSDDPPRDARIILDGNVRATRADRDPYLLGPGSSIGVLESLAGVRHAATVEVVSPVRALEISSAIIFDVIEDHTELGLAIIEALAGGLLDAAVEAAGEAAAGAEARVS